jgi:hypothetical protein
MARRAEARLLQYWQIALMAISSARRSPSHCEISREFACAIKRMVDRATPFIAQLAPAAIGAADDTFVVAIASKANSGDRDRKP